MANARSTHCHRASIVALLVAAPLVACTFEGYVPKGPPPEVEPIEPIQTMRLGEPKYGSLDCPAGECQQHYRFDVPRGGELVVVLDPHFAGEGVGLRITLGNVVGEIHGQQSAEGEEPVEIRARVERGFYYVLVQAIGGEVRFELLADLVRPGASTP